MGKEPGVTDSRGTGGGSPGNGRHELTPRQREVLRLLADGFSMREAGLVLNITPRTVAFHKYQMMAQLGLTSNAALIQYAVKQGVV
jgi:DNA-binding CsgD family transcriptional regulator